METISYSTHLTDYQNKIKEPINSSAAEKFIQFNRFLENPFKLIKEEKKFRKNQKVTGIKKINEGAQSKGINIGKKTKKNNGKNVLLLYFNGFLALSGTAGIVMTIVGLDKMNWHIKFGFAGKNLNHSYQSIFTIGFFIFCFVLCITSLLLGATLKQKKRIVGKTLEGIGIIGLASILGSMLGSVVKLPPWPSYHHQLFTSAESGALYGAITATFIAVSIFIATSCKWNDRASCLNNLKSQSVNPDTPNFFNTSSMGEERNPPMTA